MSAGIWTSQNKVLPGVYINVKSQPSVNAAVGERGIVAIAKNLSWGQPGGIIEITPGEDLTPLLGYPITDSRARFILEMTKGTDVSSPPKKIYVYRYIGDTNAGAQATCSGSVSADGDTLSYSFTAKYPGTVGNSLSVVGSVDPDTGNLVLDFYLNGTKVAKNDYIGASVVTAGVAIPFTGTFSGGTDPVTNAADDAAAMTAFEQYTFDVLCYDGNTTLVAEAYRAFVKRINEEIGRKCQLVEGNFTWQNSKYVISVANGVVLIDGTTLTSYQTAWWLAGAEAGANYNQSLTYAQYPGAVAANPKLSYADQADTLTGGQIALFDDFGTVKILTDINSKTTVTVDEGAEFKKNRVMRVVNTFCNDTYEYFSTYFIGKVDNNAEGRSLLRAWIIGYLNEMQANNGIQNFTAEDVEVLPGDAIDAVLINVAIQPVDSVEKIYIAVTVSITTTQNA